MEPDVRRRLHRAWGMCGRHAWGALAVETSYRYGYLHGPAALYEDLMDRARRTLRRTAPGCRAHLDGVPAADRSGLPGRGLEDRG